MKTFFLLTTLFAFTISVDPTPCTNAIKDTVDDLFEVVLDVEQHGFQMTSQSLKDVLAGVTEILSQCAGSAVDLNKYDGCVDALMPVSPLVQKLITDIKAGVTNNIMLDVTQIGLQLANGITSCVSGPKMMVGEYRL